MKRAPVNDTEKMEIGARIKRLRKEAGLRQWQLAEMIGATQPAIHMYERGVLPEPKRLLELARIGNTTVEWILTGRHWENGSAEMTRVPTDICDLAARFREYSDDDRQALDAALDVINGAVASIQKAAREDVDGLEAEEIARRLKDFTRETRRALSAALEIHYAVHRALLEQGVDRMKGSTVYDSGREMVDEGAGKGRRHVYLRASALEPVRGNLFRLDNSLLALNEILRDKEIRKEFEETVNKLLVRLDNRKSKAGRPRKRASR